MSPFDAFASPLCGTTSTGRTVQFIDLNEFVPASRMSRRFYKHSHARAHTYAHIHIMYDKVRQWDAQIGINSLHRLTSCPTSKQVGQIDLQYQKGFLSYFGSNNTNTERE
jgi:hypothetical protein